jgi:hypothetical protein
MLRLALILPAALALAACQPQVPDSARGVGFESYSDYMKRRDAELAAGGSILPGPAISRERIGTPAPLPGGAAAAPAPVTAMPLPLPGAVATPAPVTTAPVAGDRPRADTIAGVAPQSGEMARVGISDEQDFSAVSARESIESDAERRRRQAEQYVVVPPAPLPTRAGPSGPNIVQFALATSHAPGTKTYSRSGLRLRSYEAACGPFSSADLAQEEFLRRGGPERDPLGVDPDGDGFACGWDPRPFRLVKQ